MVRLWQVSPEILDGRRLNGAHNEVHILISVHLKILKMAREQGVSIDQIDWSGTRLGWRTHPQVTWWFGKVGAVFEYHDIVVKEMNDRKMAKGQEVTDHKSPTLDQFYQLKQLDPDDISYGHFWEIVDAYPDRQIRDLRHLFEKWDKELASDRWPTGYRPDLAFTTLRLLVPNLEELSRMLDEKLLT